MGSLLNFVFEKSIDDINGEHFCLGGPIKNRIEKYYSTTSNLQIKDGYKNILFYEINHPDEFLKYILSKKEILSLLDRDDFKIAYMRTADPTDERFYDENYDDIQKKLNNKVIFMDTNVRLDSKAFVFHFFLEEAAEQFNQIFYGHDKFQEQLKYSNEPISIDDLDVFRNNKFLCFNRTLEKYHRYRLFLDWNENNFNDSLFSFLNVYKSSGYDILDIVKTYGEDYCNNLEKKLPIEVDTHNIKRDGKLVEWDRTHNNFKKELFLDSCINIVTETTFENNELFISEKIVKPLVGFQPFIVLGPQYYLKELRKLGFKTFDSIWDESYDDEEDFKKRYEKVLKLILKINENDVNEVNEMYKSVKDICIYNHNHFKSIKETSIYKIFKQIENEW